MSPRKQLTTKGLYATVEETLTIHLDGHVSVQLKIRAQNRSDRKIAVTEPYTIPMKYASAVKAFDKKASPLIAYFNKDLGVIEVFFKPHTILHPNKTLEWEVGYNAPAFGIKDNNNAFTGVLSITPKEKYRGIPILIHRIILHLHFEKPKPRIWWLFKRINVKLKDNQCVHLSREEKKHERTELHFDPFDLGGKRSTLRLMFTYRYGFHVNPKTALKHFASFLPLFLEILSKVKR